MRSFKQYLQETTYSAEFSKCAYHLTLPFEAPGVSISAGPRFQNDALHTAEKKLAINKKLKELGKFSLEKMFGIYSFTIYVKEEITFETIAKIKQIIFEETGFQEKDVKWEVIWLDGFPKFKVQCKSVLLDCAPADSNVEVQTLKGIEHFVECEKFTIANSYMLKSSILGVFKIKGIKEFSIEENTEDNLRPDFHPDDVNDDWIHIVLDNFKNGRKLSKAQTELFKSGYKELAKL